MKGSQFGDQFFDSETMTPQSSSRNGIVDTETFDRSGYDDWRAVAGYFDGDGCVLIRIRQFVLVFYLQWTESSRSQLDQLLSFLRSQGVTTTRIYPYPEQEAFMLRITRQESVSDVAARIAPYCFKKKGELEVVRDYYGDKMSGDEAAHTINDRIRKGYREGDSLSVRLPYTHKEGVRLARRRCHLTDAQRREIREQYQLPCLSTCQLARMYSVTPTTIRNILKH